MKKVLKYKSDIIAYIGSILMIVGTILPIVKIDNMYKNFIGENGRLVVVLALLGMILYLFKVGFFSFIPAIGSLVIVYLFYNDINERMVNLNKYIPNSASYEIGLYIIIGGSILLLISSIINFFDSKKYKNETIEIKENIIDETQIEDDSNIKCILGLNEQLEYDSDFIYCKNCGAIIKKGNKKCFFCDYNIND